ncbi:MAG: bacteriohemerythrin, partial [Treponema sp.]|nr:bacteriohemerythrin [Treponema sp.]
AFSFTADLLRDAKKYRPLLKDGVNWSNVRVLAVDDEPEIVRYFEEIAQRFGIVCDVALSGEDALKLLDKNGAYDIYFIDWKMPGMNGMELSRRVKEFNSGKSVVTMISGTEWSVIENDAKKAGVDKFLAKPLFPSSIADLINECIGLYSPESNGEKAADYDDNFEGCNILLAEDVDINREIVLALLEPKKINIDCAGNGIEALGMFSEAPDKYDMIFMDVQMPEMDGYEATRRIRSLDFEKARSIPIVAMTANVFREDIEKSLAAGMNDHVGKPLDFDELIKKLRKYLPDNEKQNIPFMKYNEAESPDQENWKHGVAWSTDLESGNAAIDSQHKQIFRLINSLAAACVEGRGVETLGDTLEFLAGYTIRHFADEEALQEVYQYPALEEHKKLHDEFKETVSSLVARYKSDGSSEMLFDQVNSVIVRWLIRHIKGEDYKIAEFIRKQENE